MPEDRDSAEHRRRRVVESVIQERMEWGKMRADATADAVLAALARVDKQPVDEWADHRRVMEDVLHSVWLYGNWKWITKNMTAQERTTFADAASRRLNYDHPAWTPPTDRWWRW